MNSLFQDEFIQEYIASLQSDLGPGAKIEVLSISPSGEVRTSVTFPPGTPSAVIDAAEEKLNQGLAGLAALSSNVFINSLGKLTLPPGSVQKVVNAPPGVVVSPSPPPPPPRPSPPQRPPPPRPPPPRPPPKTPSAQLKPPPPPPPPPPPVPSGGTTWTGRRIAVVVSGIALGTVGVVVAALGAAKLMQLALAAPAAVHPMPVQFVPDPTIVRNVGAGAGASSMRSETTTASNAVRASAALR